MAFNKTLAKTVANSTLNIERVFPNSGAVNSWVWNYYVKESDPTQDYSRVSGGNCVHAGPMRRAAVAGKTTCSGLTAADSRDAFIWTCSLVNGKAVFQSQGFKLGKGLKDLISANAFLPMVLTVTSASQTYQSLAGQPWWTDSVTPLAVNQSADVLLNNSDTIYTLAASATSDTVRISNHRVSLVTLGNSQLKFSTTGTGSLVYSFNNSGIDFPWIETSLDGESGTVNATDNISINNSYCPQLRLVTSPNAGNTGIYFNNVHYARISETKSFNNVARGLDLLNSRGTRVLQFLGVNNTGNGVFINNTNGVAGDNVFHQAAFSNNGSGIRIYQSQSNVFVDVYANNNLAKGIDINMDSAGTYQPAFNTFINVITANNSAEGIMFSSATHDTNMIRSATINNSSRGIDISGISGLISSSNQFHEFVAAHNSWYGVHFNSYVASSNFYGMLRVGNNAFGQCDIVETLNQSNVYAGATQNCIARPASGISVLSGQDLTSTFVEELTLGDSANQHDAAIDVGDGFVAFSSIADWTQFSTRYRSWGKGGSTSLINSANRGRCTTGNCGAFDWSLRSTDTVLRQVYNGCPHSEEFLDHQYTGSTTTYLQNAVEIIYDGIGNENGLCEKNESCIVTRNIGPYQGHGNLIPSPCGNIPVGGTVDNVTLYEYPTNGYPVSSLTPLGAPGSYPGGLNSGHFDLSTAHLVYPFNGGAVDTHIHDYSGKNGINGVDFFNVIDDSLANITSTITNPNQRFILIVANASFSTAGVVQVNDQLSSVVNYQAQVGNGSSLPVYTLGTPTIATDRQLTRLKLSFPLDAIINGGLVESFTGCVSSNLPGPTGEYRNRALLIQALNADQYSIDPATGTAAQVNGGLLWEGIVYWHEDGDCQ